MFPATIGKFDSQEERVVVDQLREWSYTYFKKDLEERPSLHRYVKTLPKEVIAKIDKLRYSKQILQDICKHFQKETCDITRLDMTDEIYISHYNMDKGGDQGLFDKHYDGNLRFIDNATVVRALIYISSDDDYVVHFEDSNIAKNFKTYEYGILDFHKEYHWVEGSYNSSDTPRILLKCNYLVCPKCSDSYKSLNVWMNKWVFYIVKACMEYSKSPQTPLQYIIGFICNLFRRLNIIHPILPIVAIIFFILLVIYIIKMIKYLIIRKKSLPKRKRN